MKRIVVGIATAIVIATVFVPALDAQEASRNVLDSLRARIDAVSREQQEEIRRLQEARQAELEALRQALDAERSRIADAERSLVEAERALANARLDQLPSTDGTARLELRNTTSSSSSSSLNTNSTLSANVTERLASPTRLASERLETRSLSILLNANPLIGADLVTLTPALAPYFDVESGVLVTEVTESSPAAASGLLPGDVIVEIGESRISAVDDVGPAIGAFFQSQPLTVEEERAALEEGLAVRQRISSEAQRLSVERGAEGPEGSQDSPTVAWQRFMYSAPNRSVVTMFRSGTPVPLRIIREGREMEITLIPPRT